MFSTYYQQIQYFVYDLSELKRAEKRIKTRTGSLF